MTPAAAPTATDSALTIFAQLGAVAALTQRQEDAHWLVAISAAGIAGIAGLLAIYRHLRAIRRERRERRKE